MEPILILWGMSICFSCALAFNLGKKAERIEWNELIKEGKIPAPKRNK